MVSVARVYLYGEPIGSVSWDELGNCITQQFPI